MITFYIVRRRTLAVTTPQSAIRRWARSNRGVFTEIAVSCVVSAEYVRQVAYGTAYAKYSDKLEQIKRELREKGWPGMTGLV